MLYIGNPGRRFPFPVWNIGGGRIWRTCSPIRRRRLPPESAALEFQMTINIPTTPTLASGTAVIIIFLWYRAEARRDVEGPVFL